MQRHWSLIVPASVGFVLILLTSILQGRWTQRWEDTTSEELLTLAAAYEKIPMSVGDWTGERHPEPTNRRELEMAGAKGHLSASFTNPRTGQVASVYMICGISRDVSVHTPEACYPGAGFLMEGKPQKFPIRVGDTEVEFTTAVFTKSTPTGTQRLRLFWAWNAHGRWESPDWPRLRFGGRQALNKLYLIGDAPPDQPIHESPLLAFGSQFLAAVEKVLFPSPASLPASAPAQP
ncbi:MAG: exosortase-associated EpsI family protein [Thermoguttaceae bacterium]|jgi:hypothetical protein